MLSALTFFFSYYFLAGLALNLGYHRILSHRSAKLSKWFERTIITIGLPAGTPIQWIGNHRAHHMYADTSQDPHSPHHLGFWGAHVGWYISSRNFFVCILYALAGPLRTLFDGWNRPRTNQQYIHLASDVAKDPYYAWISRPLPFQIICCLHVVISASTSVAMMGSWHGLILYYVTSVAIYNLGDSIDSVSHLIGKRPYNSTHKAGNHWLMGILILGDGWHANHHTFPESARHGILPGQFDWTWNVIKVLKLLGIARDIKREPLEGSRIKARVA